MRVRKIVKFKGTGISKIKTRIYCHVIPNHVYL